MKSGKRSFTIEMAAHKDGCPTKFSRKDYTGRYESSSHAGAAKKALTQLCRVKKVKGQCSLYITMRETTQGSAGKSLSYLVRRVKLKEPIELNGRTLEYTSVIKSVDEDKIPKCNKSHKSSGRMSKKSSKKMHKKSSAKSSKKNTKKSTGLFSGLF
tara:strand:- start:1621 stop:2088 length:468 start_codon:yes stop_codon:yes gene_type:complete